MRSFTVHCVILGHKNLAENDKLVFLYSEETGKIKAVAKGARRLNSKFTGHLETLNFCQVALYRGPRNIIIQEIISLNNEHRKINCLNIGSSLMQIAEITDKILLEEQKLEQLLSLIQQCCQRITISQKPQLIALAYIIKLLDKVGLLPDFYELQSTLPEKYCKFFNYLQKAALEEIERIQLSPKESQEIYSLVKKIIERETERHFHSFLTTLSTP